ncbi:MAG: hypothetical protein AAF335_00710, partial [Bacteroidota bacterium]
PAGPAAPARPVPAARAAPPPHGCAAPRAPPPVGGGAGDGNCSYFDPGAPGAQATGWDYDDSGSLTELGTSVRNCIRASNPHNLVKATFDALQQQNSAQMVAKRRGISIEKVFNG